MGVLTLEGIMSSMALHLNGDTVVPTEGTDEYNKWKQAVNESQRDWSSVDYDWETLYAVFSTSLSQSGTTLSLPANFVKLAGFPEFAGTQYPEQRKQETGRFDASEKYVTVDYGQKILSVNPPQSSNVSAKIPFYSEPSNLTSLTQTSLCPNDNYLVYRSVGKVLLSKENPKFQAFIDESEKLLARMIGKEVIRSDQYDNTVKNDIHTKYNFTLGVD